MSGSNDDVNINAVVAEAHANAPAPGIWHRNYFSSHLLWTAQHEAALAGRIEGAHAGRPVSSIEHRAYVLSSIVASAGFLEAMVNELFQDAADGYGHEGCIGPLSPECRALMADLWRTTDQGKKLEPVEKYERLLEFASVPALDRGGQLYEDALLVVRLRNAIVHYRPEKLSAADEAHAFEKSLGRKFADNALMEGSGNPWWPDHALGHGCAEWAYRAVEALADHVCDAVGITPNYRRHEAASWFDRTPGVTWLDDAAGDGQSA